MLTLISYHFWPVIGWLVFGWPGMAAQAPPVARQDPAADSPRPEAVAGTPAGTCAKEFVFEPGAGEPPIRFPSGEQLVYRAYLDIGVLQASVGRVTQTCKVEPFRPSILLTNPGPPGETAVVQLHAEGHTPLYSLESTIESRILPQDWPRIRYFQESEGTEKRRREVLLGRREGELRASYRRDTDRGAPKGSRIWRPATERDVPEGTIDMLSAVLMARTLIREGRASITFPLIDKTRVWQLQILRGEERRMETDVGLFDVVEVVLQPDPHPGEVFEQEKLDQFEGVFGIHGTIHLWVEKRTGIAVRIQGDLPVVVGIDVKLESYSGTPAEFAPLR